MKKILISLVIGLLIGALAVFFILQETTPQKIESVEKNSFYEVSSKLNLGGNLYMYLSTEKVIQTVDQFAGKLREILQTQAANLKNQKVNPLAVFDLVHRMVQNSGLMDISGVGLSAIAIGENLNHANFVIHHYPGKGQGLIWNLMEKTPRDLDEIKLLPAHTVMAGFADLKLKTLWNWIKKEVGESDIPDLKEAVLSAEPLLQSQGIELEKLLDSLSGRVGLVMALDAENKSKIPLGQMTVDLPNPDLALVVSAEDPYLFDLLKKIMPFAKKTEEKDGNKLVIPVPAGAPFPLKPVIWLKDKWLFIASNEEFVNAMLTARKENDGLVKTREFQKLSPHMPKKGNSFRFVSTRLFDLLMDIQQKAMAVSPAAQQEKIGREILDMFPKKFSLYQVTQNSKEGLVVTANTNLGIEYIALLPATAAAGMIAAVATPNLIMAAEKGKQKATMGDLKLIATAIEMYIVDKGFPPQGNSLEEIRALLEPHYLKTLPLEDGWGNEYHYRAVNLEDKPVYYIASGGKDGVFEGFDQNVFYTVSRPRDFNRDIILKNGEFVCGPRIK